MRSIQSRRIIVGVNVVGLAAFIAVGYGRTQQQLAVTPPPAPSTPAHTFGQTPVAVAASINQLNLNSIGQRLILEGTLTEELEFLAGRRFTLDNDSGSITLLIWQEVVEMLPPPEYLAQGMWVRVTGEIDELNAVLEIIPASAGDIVVVE
jgi:DNA/RNA endonuclease YhcR with UshA esterase domain